MRVNFFTLVLDGEPWIEKHYPVFRTLDLDWRWIICEGVAANTNCTSWCAHIPPRQSFDGTHEYLHDLWEKDRRCTPYFAPLWQGGKVEMCNFATKSIDQPGLIWQVDSDEMWTKKQIEAVVKLFQQYPEATSAYFRCRYFVGPDIVTVGHDCYGNNTAYEWKRVWRFQPGQKFISHEPPILEGDIGVILPHALTEKNGCVFDHYAYATEAQVRFKQTYYAGEGNPLGYLYANAVDGWKRLQANQTWPVKLKDYLPWVDDRAQAQRIPIAKIPHPL